MISVTERRTRHFCQPVQRIGLYSLQEARQGVLRSHDRGANRQSKLSDREQSLEPNDPASHPSSATSSVTSGLSFRKISLSLFSHLQEENNNYIYFIRIL